MVTNPIYDPYQILVKIYSGGAHIKQAIADTYIEEQHRARTVKIVYGVLEKEEYLQFCIAHYAKKAPKLAVRILLKIALYMLIFMDKKRYMVTDFAVELCKKLGKSAVSGLVNAILRRFDKAEVDAAVKKQKNGESIALCYPEFALQMLQKEYGKARAASIATATSAGVSVRFVKGEQAYLERAHTVTPFSQAYGNYIFENFVRDEGFDNGLYTFQSVGSIAICDVVVPCDSLLDACAAPGGKSVLLAGKCKSVTSFELHEHRVALIEAYKARMHVDNVRALQKDSSILDSEYLSAFDGVLCDVPCSGFGTVSENPDIKLNKSAEDIRALGKTQRAILAACSQYVKDKGYLYYSTCSVFAEENDNVVEWFLQNNPHFSVEQTDSPLEHEKKKYGLQFLPDRAYGAGFYVCKLRKN